MIDRLQGRVDSGRRRTRRVLVAFLVLAVMIGSGAALEIGTADDPGPTAPPPANEPPRPSVSRFTVSTSGDLLIHSPVWFDALANGGGDRYDFGPMFQPIERFIRGPELAICHVETPITTGEPSGFPIFSAPSDLAPAIRKAGWRLCDTASNHSVDQGQPGIDETAALLREAGVARTGSFTSPRDRSRPTIIRAGDARVGLLAYTDSTNGLPPPHPWSVNLLPAADPAAAKARVVARDARRLGRAGADAIIVSMQWGDENSTAPNRSQRELARAILAIEEVDAIAGHGPHVVQPIERVGGKFVVYSAGNLLSNQGAHSGLPAETQDGLIALFRFLVSGDETRVERVDYVPIWVTQYGHEILPAGLAAADDPEHTGELAESWRRTVETVGRTRGVRPVPRRLRG